MDCIFCRIIKGELPANILYQDEQVVAFRDIHPQAPTHILIVPTQHIPTLNDLQEAQQSLVGKMLLVATQLAQKEGIAKRGYRLVINCLEEAGQAVFHIHLHLLGGRAFGWPPG